MFTNILISTFSPFPTISLAVPLTSDISDVKFLLRERYPTLPLESLYLSSHASLLPSDSIPVSELAGIEEPFLNLRLSPRLPGGKGGFGSQLRAAGGRMSSQKTSNNDSCRDLSGRRLSTIKEAKRCVFDYVELSYGAHGSTDSLNILRLNRNESPQKLRLKRLNLTLSKRNLESSRVLLQALLPTSQACWLARSTGLMIRSIWSKVGSSMRGSKVLWLLVCLLLSPAYVS